MRKLHLVLSGILLMLVVLGCSDEGETPMNSNNDTLPTIALGDVSVLEGQPALFTVTLSKAASSEVGFSFATRNGSAMATDFTAAQGTKSIPAGETSATISVATTDDSSSEPDEQFSLILSAADVAFTANDSTGVATIRDNDAAPSLQIDDVSVTEGVVAQFTITLSKAVASDVDISYRTVDQTAVAPGDYTAVVGGAATITSGTTFIRVDITTGDDTDVEPDEQFQVIISSSDAAILDSIGFGTIRNNDSPAPVSYSADVEPLLVKSGCTAAGSCHGGGGGGLTLPNTNHSTVTSAVSPNGTLVVPNSSSTSLLFTKTTSPPAFGSQMPLGGPFLTVDEQNKIRDWIDQGANDN